MPSELRFSFRRHLLSNRYRVEKMVSKDSDLLVHTMNVTRRSPVGHPRGGAWPSGRLLVNVFAQALPLLGSSKKAAAPWLRREPPVTSRPLCRKVASLMNLPAPGKPHQGGRWETIRYALDTNPRTFRLCLILLVAAVTPWLGYIIAEMIRHLLLCSSVQGLADHLD